MLLTHFMAKFVERIPDHGPIDHLVLLGDGQEEQTTFCSRILDLVTLAAKLNR
jgi:hypothetical protein